MFFSLISKPPFISFNNKNVKLVKDAIKKKDFDMNLARKYSKVLEKYSDLYTSNVSYNAGNCQINKKLSNDISLTDNDEIMINNIKESIKKIASLPYSINLFHGFEIYTKYSTLWWRKNQKIYFNHALSKTPSFEIAEGFAKDFSLWSTFYRKFLFVKYKKNHENNKHICLDIRFNDEYEYMRGFEHLTFIDIVYQISLKDFIINKFYVMKSYD